MPNHEWRFGPCEVPEGEHNVFGEPWKHAARGVRPYAGGRVIVNGYGMTEPQAMHDAQRKAAERDAHQAIGQRGETQFVGSDVSLWREGMAGE